MLPIYPDPYATDLSFDAVYQPQLDYYSHFQTPSELLSNISQPPQHYHHHDDPSPAQPSNSPVSKTESQRKARQRAIAEEIGFTPTDPDTISSHEKKRHYLECLEQYVLYLHEQLCLVQTNPLALERVSTYRGLSSRSIRTLLVHMQNTNKTLHEGTLVEEQVFLDLSSQVVATHSAGLPLRRHSVDIPGVARNPGYNSTLTAFDPLSPEASGSPPSADGSSTSPDPSTDLSNLQLLYPNPGDGM